MNKLQKEFEKTGYNSWINSDIYPDGKIYTKEYTEWLEKRLVKLLDLPHVSGSLLLRSDEICLLEKYSLWLTKNGYMDTDWKDEEPFAIDEFLKSNDR